MLEIAIPSIEKFDEDTNEFIYSEAKSLRLEHSLVSISKWESKWCKPFLSSKDKTVEETIDYIRCMSMDDISSEVLENLTNKNISEVMGYINSPMTATTFTEQKNSKVNNEIITSEIIYHWMIAFNVPMECQHWHLNRLLTLIRVCNIKNNPPKKMGRQEILSRNAALNAARKKQLNTKG